MQKIKILVAGNNGQLAKCLELRQSFFGAEVLCFGRPELDISKIDTIRNLVKKHKPDILINAAAYTNVDAAEDDAENAMLVNADGAQNMAICAKDYGIPLIHISTDYVFDGENKVPYTETNSPNPLGEYGRSKLIGEDLISQTFDDYVILRTSWVYSPFGKNFLLTMINLAKSGKTELNIVADQYGCPTSAIELADAIFEIATNLVSSKEKDLRGLFHLTGAGRTSWARFAKYILGYYAKKGGEVCNVKPIPTSGYPTKAKRPKYSVLDCNKLLMHHGVSIGKWHKATRYVIDKIIIENQ